MSDRTRVLIIGANHANPNRGVQALVYSVVDGLAAADPTIEPVCLAFGAGSIRQRDRVLATWQPPPTKGITPSLGRRLRDFTDRVSGGPSNRLAHADAVLDVSGGDAFATIYGERSFDRQCVHKERAIEMGVPLVLLPQTFGPFDNEAARGRARAIVGGARFVATREGHGVEELRRVLGTTRDDIETVPDVAFSLRPEEPGDEQWWTLREWADERDGPVLGLNVSGLLWHGKDGFDRTKFEAYRETTLTIVRWYLGIGGRVLLIPHVGPSASTAIQEGSDNDACAACVAALEPAERGRVLLPETRGYDCAEMKALLGLCDHFAGSRMHSWIGAASQGIPALSLAYSKKARGVLDAFTGVPLVHDLAEDAGAGVTERLRWLVDGSDRIRQSLETDVAAARSRIGAYFSKLTADLGSAERAGLIGADR